MTREARVAVVAAAFLFAVVGWAALLAPSSHGYSCGTWMAPTYDRGQASADVQRAQGYAGDSTLSLAGETSLGDRALSVATAEAVVADECGDRLASRQTITWAALAGAVLVPIAIIYIGGSGRRPEDAT